MKIDLSRFRHAFFLEAAEHVNTMEASLLSISSEPADPETMNTIFRAAHSIKGGSGTFSLEDVTRFTHALEELLDRMRQGTVAPTPPRVSLLLRACDVLRALLAAADAGSPPPDNLEETLVSLTVAQRAGDYQAEAQHTLRSRDLARSTGRVSYRIQFRPSISIFREGMDPLLILRELSDAGTVDEVSPDISRIPRIDELEADLCYLAWTIRFTTDKDAEEIRDIFAFVEDGAEIVIDPVAEDPSQVANGKPDGCVTPSQQRLSPAGSIRVATEKVDQLIDLVGESVISQSMAVEIASHLTAERVGELRSALAEMGRNTRELQERIMALRMLPVGTAFARLPRIVHDISDATGKSMKIEFSGEESELDKTILEGIVDPLTHLVRNAADHGIEDVHERREAGKPTQGTITIRARHEGGNFLVEVSDDGRGLNVDRIRQKAIERGLLSATEELPEEQLHAFIFDPGFSTAEQVSEVSGRGVGMDVVRRNVEALGGSVALKSRRGQGTQVTIKLPLTLAILEGQLVRVGAENFVLPLVSIVESVRPLSKQVRGIAGQGEVVTVRQESVPLLRLHALFGIATEVIDPACGLVAIVEHEGRRLALLVDELLGQQQVVIKNLQSNFRKVEGAMGATILGDGRVSLILDVAGLVELSRRKNLAWPSRAPGRHTHDISLPAQPAETKSPRSEDSSCNGSKIVELSRS